MRNIKRIFNLKNLLILSLTVLAALGALGIPQTFGFTDAQIIMALLFALAVDTVLERLGILEQIADQVSELVRRLDSHGQTDVLFRQRDHIPPFPNWLKEGSEIWVSGKNLLDLVTRYGRQIEDAAKAGKKLRFLVVNHENQSIVTGLSTGSLVSSSTSIWEQRARESIAQINRIIEATPPGNIEYKEDRLCSSLLIHYHRWLFP